MAAGPLGQRPAYWRILKPSPVTTKLPADRSVEDHGDRVVGQDGGSCSAAARRRGSGGGAPRRPPLRQRGGKLGVRGGAAPRQPPQGTHGVWPQGVSWLDALSLRQASLGAPPKRPSGHRHGTTPIEQSRISSSASLFVCQPPGRRGQPARPTRRCSGLRHALPCDRLPPYPYPSETRDRRSCALPRPVYYPKCPSMPASGLRACRGGVRSREPLLRTSWTLSRD